MKSDWACVGAQARDLDTGIWVELPDDDKGVGFTKWAKVKAWFILLQFDMLGRWQNGPTVESSQGKHPCDKCNFDTGKVNCYAPCTFVKMAADSGICPPVHQWTERSTSKLNEQVEHFKSLQTTTARKHYTMETGVKKTVYPFHEDCLLPSLSQPPAHAASLPSLSQRLVTTHPTLQLAPPVCRHSWM